MRLLEELFGFGRFIFEEDIKFVFDSNFSDFLVLLLLKDELEHIDSVSFIRDFKDEKDLSNTKYKVIDVENPSNP